MSTEHDMENQESSSDDWGLLKMLAPYLAGTAIVAALLTLAILRFVSGGVAIKAVTFDIIKYTNSQRAVASSLLGATSANQGEASQLLLDVSKRTRTSISKIAGEGTLVFIKQGVVQGAMRDITDDVLKDLNLPTDVPSADGTEAALDAAPTSLGFYAQPKPIGSEALKSSAKNSAAELP